MEIQYDYNSSPTFYFGGEKEFYNKDLIKVFGLKEKDYNLFKIFFASKFKTSLDEIEKQKEKLIKILSDKVFLYEFNILLDDYLAEEHPGTQAETSKRDNLIKLKSLLMEIGKSSDIKKIDETIRNTELLGDLVIHTIVEAIITSIEDKYKNTKCENKLKSFLNSNVLMYNIIKGLTNLDISTFFPVDFQYRLRLANRAQTKRNEIFNLGCIDYKYYANLVEQIFGYIFITQGFKRTVDIFDRVLRWSGFIVDDFLKNCMEPKSKPYNGMILRPGCSCKDTKGERVCDNPKPFEPKYFKNFPCPLECPPTDVEFFVTSSKDAQFQFIHQLANSELDKLFGDITNQSFDFFTNYIFNWRKPPYSLTNIYLYPIINFITTSNIQNKFSENTIDFINQLKKDMISFQSMEDKIIDTQNMKDDIDYYLSPYVTFPEALVILNEYPGLLTIPSKDAIIQRAYDLYLTKMNEYQTILTQPPKIKTFTVGKDISKPPERRTTRRKNITKKK